MAAHELCNPLHWTYSVLRALGGIIGKETYWAEPWTLGPVSYCWQAFSGHYRVHTSPRPRGHTSSRPHVLESTRPRVHTSPSPHISKSASSLNPHRPQVYAFSRPTPHNLENRLMLICYHTSVGKASYVFDKCLWKRSLRVPGYVFQIQHTTARKSDLKIVLECTVRAF